MMEQDDELKSKESIDESQKSLEENTCSNTDKSEKSMEENASINIESKIIEGIDEQNKLTAVECVKPSLGLNLLANYNSESSEAEDGDENNINSAIFARAVEQLPGRYREQLQDISDSDEDIIPLERILRDNEGSHSEIESESSDEEVEKTEEEKGTIEKKACSERKARIQRPPRVKGEMLLEDLPPIEDLHINVPEYECVEFGKVESIVDQLVVVKSHPNTPLLDLDSVLFLRKGQSVLGEIFDVLGQVFSPMYCVRFNSADHIKEKNIIIGELVYAAPRTQYTQMMVLPNLINSRGSDASWRNDVEPPPQHLDYSDDEEEAKAKKNLRCSAIEEIGENTASHRSPFPMHRVSNPNFRPRGSAPSMRGSYSSNHRNSNYNPWNAQNYQ